MPTFQIGFKAAAPALGLETFRAEFIGEMAAELLAGEASPLFSRLYAQGLIDADFSIGYESLPGAAFLNAEGDSDDPEAVLEAILIEAERLQKQGLEEERFQRLKKSAFGRRLRDLDSFSSICYRMAAYYFEGCDYLSFPGVYQSVTLEDVAMFLRQTVSPRQAAMSVIVPLEKGEQI